MLREESGAGGLKRPAIEGTRERKKYQQDQERRPYSTVTKAQPQKGESSEERGLWRIEEGKRKVGVSKRIQIKNLENLPVKSSLNNTKESPLYRSTG